MTSRADRGLISAPWRACPVVGTARDESELPDATGRPVALCRVRAGERLPRRPAPVPRTELLVRRFFDRICSISARFPLFFYGGSRPRRYMRYHRHVHRCHQHPAARRCRAHRRSGPDGLERVPRPRRSGTGRTRGTSRIARPPIREPRGSEAAGQAGSPAVWKDPDCRERLAFKLLRLLGGRR